MLRELRCQNVELTSRIWRAVRHAVVLLGLVALVVPVAAAGDRASPARTSGTVLAIQREKRGDVLVRLDRRTLAPTSGRLRLGGRANLAWAFSPDGRRLAVGVIHTHGLRIVDLRRMKIVGRVWTPSIYIYGLSWLGPRRIVGEAQDIGLFAVDPVTRKLLRPPSIAGNVQAIRRAGNRLVLLSGWPKWTIGFARLSVLDAAGRVRTVQLRRIKAGTLSASGDPPNVEPGLALDPPSRAFVVGGSDEPVAEVDLKTLAVTYHELPTEAKTVIGRSRRTVWLGAGRLAVWGEDWVPGRPPARIDRSPVGLSIVDLTARTIETVDPQSESVVFSAGVRTLLASAIGTGLRGYSTSGERRYQLFPEENVFTLATFDSRAWVYTIRLPSDPPRPIRVIDVASGTVLGTRPRLPRLLHPNFSTW
jgi:hypothetical protein